MEESVIRRDPIFLPVLPLKNLVTLPKSVVPVVIGRDISIRAIEYAVRHNKELFVTAQKSLDTENPAVEDLYHYGTRAAVVQVVRMPNGTLKILLEGLVRAQIVEVVQSHEFIGVMAQDLVSKMLPESPETNALWRNLFESFQEYINLNDKISHDVLSLFRGPEDLDYLADTVAVQLHLDFVERQRILEMVGLQERAVDLCVRLKKEIEILKIEKNIRKRVQSQVEKNQKDYYLNEQMRAIQRELGRDDNQEEIEGLRKKAKKLKLTQEAREKVEAELRRLELMPPISPEAAVCRNYVDWVLGLPWGVECNDTVDMDEAEKMLNASHAGLKKPKDRIIEFIAARKFAKDHLKRSPIICLAGPPGVGKTSLAQSIADSLGRPLVRVSLGGMRDEAEIRGHRRTYVGAMPGKIVQAMKKAKVCNPVILLDEIDKMAMDFRGDPASALLEALDPEQNKSFVDHYLEIDYDLSKVLFVTTANVIDGVPFPLLDRMEVISLSGYTQHEKMVIARQFLLPKILKEYALTEKQVTVDDRLLGKIIEEYTKEAGVRQLERILAKLMRKSILWFLKNKKQKTVTVDNQMVEDWLGVPVYRRDERVREENIGVVTGLAWTEVGGDVLEVEVTVLKGKGAMTLTGQLGEVMQESAQAAMSYIRSRSKDFGLKENFYADIDVHVHVPEGAIPKDGPSAGITIATALTSALTKVPVRCDIAMTGEVTLRGRVLQIGGLKEKLLAAARLGILTVIVPKSNARDVKEFAHELDKGLNIIYAESMNQVLDAALVRKPFLEIKKQSQQKAKKK